MSRLKNYHNGRRIHFPCNVQVDDITLGFDIQVYHCQDHQDKTPMVGWYVRQLPVLSDITCEPDGFNLLISKKMRSVPVN